ncbi:protein kinase family protein [Isoptericola aurantiacus]|uniref:hypothetical protein n=1 Tax=Isoptericola aurantiacus TaxID=3377839 RepID=UPI00383A025A
MQTDTVLAVPADAAARDALLERVRVIAELDHPRVEPVGAIVARPDGGLVVPRGSGTATDLPTVLAVRGRCDAAEAAGLAVDLSQALAVLHSSGLVHGELGPGDVVIDLAGRARLRPRLEVPGPQARETSDVHAVAALVDAVVAHPDDDATVALRAALAPALAADGRVRPEAGTLAAQVHDAVAPEPIRLPEPAALAAAALGGGRDAAAATTPSGRARHRPARGGGAAPGRSRAEGRGRPRRSAGRRPLGGRWRAVLGATGVACGVGLLVVLGLRVVAPDGPGAADGSVGSATSAVAADPPAAERSTAPGGQASAEDAPGPVQDLDDPEGAAAELTRRRVEVLVGGRPVDQVALAGSAAYRADAELVAGAAEDGTQVVGAQVEVRSTRTVEGPRDGRAEVVVEYVVGAHRQVAADGTTASVPAGEPRTDRLRLAWTPDGWRVTDVA